MTPQEALTLKLRKAIHQHKKLASWHLDYNNIKIALELAGRIVRTRELLHLAGGSTNHPGGSDDD